MCRDLPFQRSAGYPKAAQDSSAHKTHFSISPDGKTADGWLNTPETFAGAMVATLPLILPFLFLQRFFVRGIAMIGVKG